MGQPELQLKKESGFLRFFRKSRLRREIALILCVKLVLILFIKFTFFGNPVPEKEVEKHLQGIFEAKPSGEINTSAIHSGRSLL